MKRMFGLSTLAFLLLFLIGCDALLTFNLFSELYTPKTPSAASFRAMTDAELLSSVSDLVESETFFEDIANDDETRSAVIEGLTGIYTDGSDAPVGDKQEAALLVAEIELNTTQADEVVDDFVNVLTQYFDDPPESGEPEDFAKSVVGQVFNDVDADNFDETLEALTAAAEAYTYYGESLDDSGEVVAEEDTNTGAIAQAAIVAILISEIVDTEGDQPGLLSPEELEAVVVNDEPFPDDFAMENNPLEENTSLGNILKASGLEDLFSA